MNTQKKVLVLQMLFALAGGLFLFSEEIEKQNIPVIHVSARRFNDTELSVPASVKVISREQIEQSGASTVPEVLQTEANILIRGFGGSGSSGQPSMRGFGDNSGLRVLVMVDGQKINPADMGAIDWQQVPLGRVRSIEVLRGGQTVLYGNHALSGVIKITTDKGGSPELRAKAAVGSAGFEQYNINYGGGTENWFYSTGGDYTRHQGFRDHSLTHSKLGQLTLGRFINDNSTLTFKASLGENYVQLPGPLSYLQMEDDPTQSLNNGQEYIHSTNGLFTIAWESDHEWGSVEINAGMTRRKRSSTLSGSYSQNNQTGYSFSPRIKFGAESDFFITGFDLAYDTLEYEKYLDASRSIASSWADINRVTTGPYLFAQKETAPKLFLSGGIRYEISRTDNKNVDYIDNQLLETIETNRGPIPNPNYKTPPDIDPALSYDDVVSKNGWAAEISLNWQPTDTFSLWAGCDRVYRYPALDETASYQGYTLISETLNKDLDPETGINLELGAKLQTEHWKSSVTFFHLVLDGEIAWNGTNNVNIGTTRRIGCEAELKYEQKAYGCSTSWTLVDAKFSDGDNNGKSVPLVPTFSGTTSIWLIPTERLRLQATHTYVSSQFQGNDFSNNDRKMDAYSRFDTQANFTLSEKATIYLKVRNIFDATYAEYAYSSGFYPGDGRAFETGISVSF